MSDVIAAEWLKLRSVRSTAWLLGLLLVVLAVAWAVDTAMVSAWDTSTAAQRATFESADMGVVVGQLAQLLLGLLGALAVTAEYRTGAILTTLAAVPDRRRLLSAKTAVVAALTVVVGGATVLASTLLSLQVAGHRPAPVQPWSSVGQALGSGLAMVAALLVTALVGVGVGAALRSTAGALGTMVGLLFVGPVLAAFLPAPWNLRLAGLLPGALADQLAGRDGTLLAPAGAGLLALGYLVLALGGGAFALTRRDA